MLIMLQKLVIVHPSEIVIQEEVKKIKDWLFDIDFADISAAIDFSKKKIPELQNG